MKVAEGLPRLNGLSSRSGPGFSDQWSWQIWRLFENERGLPVQPTEGVDGTGWLWFVGPQSRARGSPV